MAADNNNGERVVGRPFQPGVSGNPGGRPKALREYQEWLRDNALDKAKQALLDCLASEDGKVRMMAVKEVGDRLFGKAPQAITGEDGKPLMPTAKEMDERIASILAGRPKQD
jgi:hypothetical protein